MNLGKNPITRRDVDVFASVLSPSKCDVQGKIIRIQPDKVDVSVQRVDVLRKIIRNFYNDVELSVDVIHLNNLKVECYLRQHT